MYRYLARALQRHAPSGAAARPMVVKAATDAASEPGSSCGWFDSSWDLRRGLMVIEHMESDPLPADVPSDWLLRLAA